MCMGREQHSGKGLCIFLRNIKIIICFGPPVVFSSIVRGQGCCACHIYESDLATDQQGKYKADEKALDLSGLLA